MLELPSILMTALSSYEFQGKTLWNISEGLKHVKVELTFLLANTPTDQQARAVKKRKPQHERQPTPAPEPTPAPAEPPSHSSPSKQPAPATTPKKRAPPPPRPSPAKPAATRKQLTTSTPTVPEPMEVVMPSAQPDEQLNRAFSQPPFVPTVAERKKVVLRRYSYDQPSKFNLRRVFRHPVDSDTLTIIEATHKKKEKACFYVHWASSPDLTYYNFKGPKTRSYNPEWWEYLVRVTETTTPLRYNESTAVKTAFKTVMKKRDGTLGHFTKTTRKK